MSDALAPALSPLDQRVLAALPEPGRAGVRAEALVAQLNGGSKWATKTDLAEVRGILRGLEHLGHARGSGGWWRRELGQAN